MKRGFDYLGMLIFSFILLLGFPAQAQHNYVPSGLQEIKVSGTSTIHDWDMVSNQGLKGTCQATLENGALVSVQALNLEIPVKSLKSGKSGMDKNAYATLQESTHPFMKFILTEIESIQGSVIKAKGKLTVAGHTEPISLVVNYKTDGSKLSFSGKYDITFSQFKIDPPTAVFNTIKTGDELSLSFNISFIPKN